MLNQIKVYRLGETKTNYQGCLMKIIEYNRSDDIIVEFQDDYKADVHSTYRNFTLGKIKNPYYPSVYGVGITGNKYPKSIDGKHTKEYSVWHGMIGRCYYEKYRNNNIAYKDSICCEDWLLYENFYEWLHSQENFDKWLVGNKWAIDKDILIKGNKIYSPETCCLVPQNVNSLFTKCDKNRGDCLIGVSQDDRYFVARCSNPLNNNKKEFLGAYFTEEKAFYSYKKRKEEIIKQVAQIEYNKGNITKECYNTMMSYEVEDAD